jgi:SRSO17 transposase
VAAGHSLDPARWQAGLEELLGRVAGRFGRVEPRRRARAFVRGLLADLPRKNCWTIAEHAGNRSPDGMQHLLSRAVWDHDGVRDDLRAYLVERHGDPEAVLVIDETGDLKKGTQTVVGPDRAAGRRGPADREAAGRSAGPGRASAQAPHHPDRPRRAGSGRVGG